MGLEYIPWQVPVGLDRADGLGGRLGTPAVPGSILIQSSQGPGIIPFEELPDSPEFERAEQATCRHRFRCSLADGMAKMYYLNRGSVWTDSSGNVWKLLSATVQNQGVHAILTTIAESMSFDPPWDEFNVTPVELGVNIIKHPRYFYALRGANQNEYLCNQFVIRRLQDYFDNVSAPYRDALVSELKYSMSPAAGGMGGLGSPTQDVSYPIIDKNGKYAGLGFTPGTDMAKAAACEIIQKYWLNEETPYLVGWQLEWKRWYFMPVPLHPGGIIEDPFVDASPQVPDYFSTTQAGYNMFAFIAALNPQCFSSDGTPYGLVNISWLRKADQVDFQRTGFWLKRTWYGTATGHWDAQLFSCFERPSTPKDYQTTAAFIPPP